MQNRCLCKAKVGNSFSPLSNLRGFLTTEFNTWP
jgi:hypothetical protein